MTTIQNKNDLLNYLVGQADSGKKDWFGFSQQRIAGIDLAYAIAANHADKMTPDEITDYVNNLNNSIFRKIVNPKNYV